MMRFMVSVLLLTMVYTLALASADPWDVGLGVLLSSGVVLLFRRFLLAGPPVPIVDVVRRVAFFPALAVATFVDIVKGTWIVSRMVLSKKIPETGGFVTIPIGDRTESGVIVSGLLNSLTPGSVLVEIDLSAETWTIHDLDTTDEAAVIANAQEFYERFQRPVWP